MNSLKLELEEVQVTTKIAETQICKKCGKPKPLSEFRIAAFGQHKTCKTCVAIQYAKTCAKKRKIRKARDQSLTNEVDQVMKLAKVIQTEEIQTSVKVSPIDVKTSIVSAVLPIIVDNNYEFTFEVSALGISINNSKMKTNE